MEWQPYHDPIIRIISCCQNKQKTLLILKRTTTPPHPHGMHNSPWFHMVNSVTCMNVGTSLMHIPLSTAIAIATHTHCSKTYLPPDSWIPFSWHPNLAKLKSVTHSYALRVCSKSWLKVALFKTYVFLFFRSSGFGLTCQIGMNLQT